MEDDNSARLDGLISRVSKYALAAEKPSRYAHSRRTGETAAGLCRRFGLDPKRGMLSGVAHDICKEAPERLLLSLAGQDGEPLSELEKQKPSLLHGRAAAVLLARDFGLGDADILEAVRNHTFGRPGMCDLAKILYIADKIEPGREYADSGYRERLSSLGLNEMLMCVVQDNMDYLGEKGKEISPLTRQMLRSLKTEHAEAER